MCLGSSPDAPVPPPKAPEAAQAPQVASSPSARTGDAARRRKAGGVGGGTILTSASGVTDTGVTATKTLLGS